MSELSTQPASTQNVEFTLIPADELQERYVASVRSATSRVVLQSMSMTYGEATAPILDAVAEQAGDIDVLLLPDSFSERFDAAHLAVNPFGDHAQAIKDFKAYTAGLQERGGRVRFTNPYPSILSHPYRGRSHIKFLIADDDVYDFGGVDVKRTGFRNADSMVRYRSAELADRLHRFAELTYKLGHLSQLADSREVIDDASYVITDMGAPGRSAIYDEVARLFEAPDTVGITFLSQFRPTGQIEQALIAKSKQNQDGVVVFCNRPNQLVIPAHITETLRARRSKLEVGHLPDGSYLHEKVALVTRENAPTILIKGSHNMLDQGVRYGTAERMLFTTDPGLVEQAEQRVRKLTSS